MADRPRRSARGDVCQRAEIILVPVGMVHQLEAHRRDADEISHLLLLDQAQGVGRIPFGHHHQAAADDKAVEHDRHFAGDVEQGHREQGARLGRPAAAILHQQLAQHHQSAGISVGRRRHRPMRRQCALGFAGRTRREQDRRVVIGRDLRQGCSVIRARQKVGDRLFHRQFDRKADHVTVRAAVDDPLGTRRVGDDQLRVGQRDRMLGLLAFPPAVEQGCHAPGLEDRHIADDPRRAVAHHHSDAVAFGDPPRGEPVRQPLGNAVEVGEAQPFVAGDHRLRGAIERAEGTEKRWQGRRQFRSDCAAPLIVP